MCIEPCTVHNAQQAVQDRRASTSLPPQVDAVAMGRLQKTVYQIYASSKIPPRLVIILQVDASRHFQIRRDVRGRVSLLCPPSVSQPRKTIIRLHVRVLPVFPPRFPPNPGDMSGTARPQSVDSALRPSPVGPRTATLTQDCAREERIAIF